MLNIAVFVSGQGSNLKAILKEIDSGRLSVKIKAVVSNVKKCGAI
ncbi:MAG: formyltransferase family protein, partial [Melioribacteraceae bacterium]